jgi:hypothetical protein
LILSKIISKFPVLTPPGGGYGAPLGLLEAGAFVPEVYTSGYYVISPSGLWNYAVLTDPSAAPSALLRAKGFSG